MARYRLEGTVIEDIDTYVRISLGNGKVAVTKNELPDGAEVASLLEAMQGYFPNRAQLNACSRAAENAKNNVMELAL
jgi:hypothetical protein